MKRYRIKTLVFKNDTSVYFAQKRFMFFFWINMKNESGKVEFTNKTTADWVVTLDIFRGSAITTYDYR